MKLCFVDTEPPERKFFEREFSKEELHFCNSLAWTKEDVEILSIFIDSKVDAAFLDSHPALRLVATRSTTYDHIDLEACAERDVTVCAVGSYGDHTVAEHSIGLLLAIARRMREAMHANTARTFSYDALRSTELCGKTFGVIGAGRIGRQTLRLARAFGMETLASDTKPDPEVAAKIGFTYVTFDEILRRSHFISLHIPLTPETVHLFNRETFARCRRGVILINTARGGLIEPDALIAALDAGIVGGAGLDVLEDERVMRKPTSRILTGEIMDQLQRQCAPTEALHQKADRVKAVQKLMRNSDLLAHPNVVFTPHIAFNSIEALERINRATVENIRAFEAGDPRNTISPSGPARVCASGSK